MVIKLSTKNSKTGQIVPREHGLVGLRLCGLRSGGWLSRFGMDSDTISCNASLYVFVILVEGYRHAHPRSWVISGKGSGLLCRPEPQAEGGRNHGDHPTGPGFAQSPKNLPVHIFRCRLFLRGFVWGPRADASCRRTSFAVPTGRGIPRHAKT